MQKIIFTKLEKNYMKIKFSLLLVYLTFTPFMNAQDVKIEVPIYINVGVGKSLQENIIYSLSKFTSETDFNNISSLFNSNNKEITIDLLSQLNIVIRQSVDTKKQLINIYKVENDKYLLQLAYYIPNTNGGLTLTALASFLTYVDPEDNAISFSSPVSYYTKSWNTKSIGNINYIYKSTFCEKVAVEFNKNNSKISKNLGLELEKLVFFKSSNYQEVLRLIGLDYIMSANGEIESSTIIGNTILTGLNTEDFSHDIFHFYSSKLFERKERNWIAEEGFAYSWGNAYYTDSNSQVISRKELIDELKIYLKNEVDSNLFKMFTENPPIFQKFSPKVSVRSTISSILCDEVERKRGIDGVRQLVSCGNGLDNFFLKVEELININNANFDSKVRELLSSY